MEHGPQITKSRSDFCWIISMASLRPSSTVRIEDSGLNKASALRQRGLGEEQHQQKEVRLEAEQVVSGDLGQELHDTK